MSLNPQTFHNATMLKNEYLKNSLCKSKGLHLLHLNVKSMNREILIANNGIVVSESELDQSVIQSGMHFHNYVLRCDRNRRVGGVF